MYEIKRFDLSLLNEKYKGLKTYDKDVLCCECINSHKWSSGIILNACTISIVLNGSAEIYVRDIKYTINKNDLFFTHISVPFKLSYSSKDFDILMVFTSKEFLDSLFSENNYLIKILLKMANYKKPYVSLTDKETNVFSTLIRCIANNTEVNHHNKRLWFKTKITELFLEIDNINNNNEIQPDYKDLIHNNHAIDIFQNFFSLLLTNYKKEQEASFYAEQLNITTRYLSKIVKEISSITIKDHINNMLIEESYHLLSSTDMTVQQISFELSFSDQSSFSKFFKRNTGMSPVEYRNNKK
jgi:AraC-like DNA-binding protein